MSKVFVLIVSLLPFIRCENPELKLIDGLNNFFNFDHNLFLLESSMDSSRFISSTSRVPQTVYVFKNVVAGNITELETVKNISSKNTFTVVAFVDSSFERNLNFFGQLQTIQRLQLNMKIGIFLPQLASMDDLRELFVWCKENLIVNVFAAIKGSTTTEDVLNIFSFHPFGPFEVLNVTTSESYENYFPSLQSNFRQHRLHAYSTSPAPLEINKEIWSIVIRMMNGSYVVETNYSAHSNDIFMTYNLYTQSDIDELNVSPIFLVTEEIVVPEALPYENFSAYLQVMTSDEFFGYSLATIAALIILLAVCRYIKESKILFFQSAADVLNLLMNDNMYIRYQQLSRAEFLVIGPLTFVGFIVVSGILSNLQSYLTRPVLQPQIKTLEDIHGSPFPILTYGDLWKAELIKKLANRTKYEDWSDKIIAMEPLECHEVIGKFNMSISFYEDDSSFDVRLRVQKRLKIKGYYNPKLQIAKYFVSYLVLNKFLFFDRFNDIIHRMKSAGLIDLWEERNNKEYETKLLIANRERLKDFQAGDVQQIEFPMFIVYGWAASCILFVLEIVWKNRRQFTSQIHKGISR